jgi:mono/diheme cytochrome c family protein
MIKRALFSTLPALLLAAAPISANADGAAAYRACAACHLPDGAGVPGAFPPLRNRIASKLDDAASRQYLVAVVSNGLTGPITVDGTAYAGFMQAFAATMNAERIAATLNYVASELRDDKSGELNLFTAEEVTELQQAAKGKAAAALRPEAF